MIKRFLTLASHKIHSMPVIVLMPHSSCNCRCVMCDIWKANNAKREVSVETLETHVDSFKKLDVREVVLSGGEALMHSNLWKLCDVLKKNKIRITLLSTGLLLGKFSKEITANIDNVIVSIDGSEAVHDRIRNIPRAFSKMAEGIRQLRSLKSDFPITGRCVLQRGNFFDFVNTVTAAHEIGLNQISFLAADVSSQAFNHPEGWSDEKTQEVALTNNEVIEFDRIVRNSFVELVQDYNSKFIAETPAKMLKIVQYYKAVNGEGEFPAIVCNAPWVSAVVESDGSVAPCFFHKPYGNINDASFLELINSKEAVAFRRRLDMRTDDVCRRCVCSIRLRPYQLLK